jgi:hypothetical protein
LFGKDQALQMPLMQSAPVRQPRPFAQSPARDCRRANNNR